MNNGYTYKRLSITKETIKIEPHDDLSKNILDDKEVKKLALGMTTDEFNDTYHPVLFEVAPDEYYLRVGREWSHAYLVDQKLKDDQDKRKEILYAIIKDKTRTAAEIKKDAHEMMLLKHGVKAIKGRSKVTDIRKEKMNVRGLACPDCKKYPLGYAIFVPQPDKQGLYTLKCYNHSQGRCCCKVKITPYELKLYREGKLRTSDLLVPIVGKPCPHCGRKHLYLRIMRYSETETKLFEICLCSLQETPFCLYKKDVTNDFKNGQAEFLFEKDDKEA
jgi:hypothetical protein